MRDHNYDIESKDVNEYEEFEDKYHQENDYELPPSRSHKIRPVPFVNIKKSEYSLLYVDTNSLPKIDKEIYTQIENFPDFDYVNSIAYEMLTRTKEYKQIDKNRKLTINKKIKSFDKLGVDYYEVRRFRSKNNPARKFYNKLKEERLFKSNYNLTLQDINNGFNELIAFYLKKEQIFKRERYQENGFGIITDIKYRLDKSVTYEDIISSPSDFFIPAKFDYEKPENRYLICKIDKNIPLFALKNEFLEYIEESIPNNIKGKILFNFTRPLLRFKESANVDVQINLNLSKDAILDLVGKLKDEFDRGEVRTPLGFLYDKSYLIEDWGKDIPFKFTKKSMARAFFVYDLYQAIDIAFQIKKKQLNEEKDSLIEKVKEDIKKEMLKKENETTNIINNLDDSIKNKRETISTFKKDLKRKETALKKKKEKEIKKIKNRYKFECQTFHTEDVLIELLEKHDITSYTCKRYLQYMRKCIEDTKYKKLIIGTKTTNH